jgi:hypothetical protein
MDKLVNIFNGLTVTLFKQNAYQKAPEPLSITPLLPSVLLRLTCVLVRVCVYVQQDLTKVWHLLQNPTRVQWGEKVLDPLLILYVCPLTKKWSVYNYNGRFIWTVKDRITTTKIQKNTCQIFYKLICILMREVSIWSPLNQKDFWLPGAFYTGNELKLGAHS